MFYESLAFNEGGNDGFWRFQLRDKYGRWIKMGGSAMFEFRKPNDKNVYKAKGTFQGNIRRGWSIIRVGEGEQLPPGDYEIDSRYIESIKAIINTTSAKPETVDAPKSINPDVEKQAAEREMVAATVKDLEAGDIVQQSTEEALYGQINSVEHGDAESKINVTWSDGSNYDMTLPGDQKIKIWGAEPEVETVDAPKPKSRFEAPTDPAEIEALKAKAEEQKARVAEVEKEREERLKLKAEQEAKAAESYRMAHRPPGRSDTDEEGVAASLDKIDQVFSQGILDPEKQQSLFRTGDAEADKETFDIINSIKGNPDAEVTIYRGVPDGVDAIGAGDWVTLSPSYAQHHVDANVPNGKVISMKVKASELFTNADSINEWGYDPEPETVDAGNGEEKETEVPEATRVIDSEREASVLYQELSKKFNLTNSAGGAASARKRNAARVTLDKMLADGVTLSQLADASKSIGPIAIKQGTNYWDALDFESVFNKLPETPGIGSLVSVNPYSIINAPYDDDTVMGSETYVNAMKFNEDGFLEVFTLNVVDTLDVKGLTLKEVQAQAQSEPSISGFYGDFAVVGTTESKRMLAESFTSKLIQTWANTSNDTDADSLAIQEVARLLFNLEDAADWDVDDVLRGDVQDNLNAHGATYQSFLTAQYEVTQEFLEEQGIKEFTLYRGFTSKFKIDTGYTDSVLRPLSSFSTSKKQAEEFALPGGFDYAYVIDMVIPAEDVLSMPGLGFGCYEEEEIVVLGGKKSAFIEML
jgi:hypothetical protein